MSTLYPKGAEWRKWDLHFHTPSSYDYKDKSVANTDIIETLANNEVSVVVITDHHIMDIERIKKLQEIGAKRGITVLPGIEFLSDTRGSEPVHFIGIFSEKCRLEYVWGQIRNRTPISRMAGEDKKANEVYCNLIETTDLVHELGGIATIHSGQKHGTIETITNSLQHTMAQKEDIALNVDIYELGRSDDQEGYRKIVFPCIGKVLPMVICSDNHNCRNYQLKVNCWLKADPTFEGLKQVIIEPEERVFIGDRPQLLERILKNRTKYIAELSIAQVEGYNERQNGVWFKDVSIPLNSELVAIIGNKGSGKSAIADVIALCSNYQPNDDDFSFLTKNKFKNRRLAANFEASITWQSGIPSKINLNDEPASTELLDVKYLPQGQFERLTNEINTAKQFQQEIESVVFSHIPTSENLQTQSFDELIDKKTSSVNLEIKGYASDIQEINKSIIELEQKSTISFRAEIESKLKKKKEELDSLIEPPSVSDPNIDPEKKKLNEAVNLKIDELKKEIQSIQDSIFVAESEKKEALESLQKLVSTKSDVERKEVEFGTFISKIEYELANFKIDIQKLISVNVDFTEITALIVDKQNVLEKAKEKLGEVEVKDGTTSLINQLDEKQKQLNVENLQLDSEQQHYQRYLVKKTNWQNDRDAILGAFDRFDTLEFYNNELIYLEKTLDSELKSKYEERREIVRVIFDKKQDVIAVYKNIRKRLSAIIDDNQRTLRDYKIEVDASLVKSAGFNTKFLDFILQNRIGTFHSKDGGEIQLIQLLAEADFDEKESVISLLDNLIDALRFDKRDKQNNAPRVVSEQVKDVSSLYEYLFTLSFLEKNYQLKQGDKELERLSPGERGALLLVFYLLLDNSDIPLVIDQPEDNLDNHSVATILVPFIKVAKKKRQIIIVTHNPNLAVVADAEQVVYVELDKENNYTFSVISGSIEDKTINKKIVDVLEGAMPAFDKRKRKYYD